MKIYLLDINPTITYCWKRVFGNKVQIVTDKFDNFMDNHKVDCIVSPANSKGIMNGGYDEAISDYFGWELTANVQSYIASHYKDGYQPVGTSLIFDIPDSKIKLIHTPTMISPTTISDPKVIYKCMKSTLECAIANNIKSIVIPAFGGLTGGLEPDVIAKQMYLAYKQVMEK